MPGPGELWGLRLMREGVQARLRDPDHRWALQTGLLQPNDKEGERALSVSIPQDPQQFYPKPPMEPRTTA
ncbi:hypothetical protein AAFF_G00036190 [Aldrovandia affinis]|uniref:Uncharacterized protein n=1 Tax=Aldrovandia affinis TaxID=143900 RepID=A0AAD7S3I7_9TELE|nr:hypothetical protein AAFF_G00036190 [Aldrovandia affinis]